CTAGPGWRPVIDKASWLAGPGPHDGSHLPLSGEYGAAAAVLRWKLGGHRWCHGTVRWTGLHVGNAGGGTQEPAGDSIHDTRNGEPLVVANSTFCCRNTDVSSRIEMRFHRSYMKWG